MTRRFRTLEGRTIEWCDTTAIFRQRAKAHRAIGAGKTYPVSHVESPEEVVLPSLKRGSQIRDACPYATYATYATSATYARDELDRAEASQRRDLIRRITELRHHFVGVFAEQR